MHICVDYRYPPNENNYIFTEKGLIEIMSEEE